MNKDLLNLKRPPSALWAYLCRCFDPSCVKLKSLMVFAFLFSTAVLFAQERSVSGKVSDENGMGIPGVNVLIRGTSNGTTSDAEGKYSITVSSGEDVLVFSFIGYAGQEIAVGTNSTIDVTLQPDITSLEEVVVTALGVKKESKKLGYAVTSVKTDELISQRTTNLMESLEGKVAGLNITPPAAGAGSSMQIRLRGQAAFAGGNNAPLIVINGLPIDQGARGANGNGNENQRDRGDNLQNLNPDDVESMTVLKGATAAALYGSRAANGAIIITTKSGNKNQGLGVDFTSSFTASTALNFLDEIVQTEYGQGQSGAKFTTFGQAQANGQFGWGAKLDGQPTINFDGVMRPYSAYPNQLYDFLQTGKNFTNTLGLSGGGANGSFRASFSNVEATGIVPRNEYTKRIFNLGVNHDITKKLKLQLNVNYADENSDNAPAIGTQGDGVVNFFNRMPISVPLEAYRDNPIDPVTGGEWKTNGFLGTINNPYVPIVTNQFFKDNRNRLLGTSTLRYQFTSWLYAQGRFNYDKSHNFLEYNRPSAVGSGVLTQVIDGVTTYRGTYNLRMNDVTSINADFLVGGSKEFGKYSVDASFGGNTYRTKFKQMDQDASRFTVPDLYSIPNGTVKNQSFGYSETRVNSLYGWAELGYNGMVYLNLTGREDWFSTLNPKQNSVFYPSVTGSFIFSELLPNQEWLSYGKLRGGWAQAGSSNGADPYAGVLTYAINQNQFNGQTLASVSGNNAPNPLLIPYLVTEKEIGMELKMFNNRVSVDVAAFDKVTTDQIITVTPSTASGYTGSTENKASLKNSGIESAIEFKAVQSPNVSWTTSWNNSFLKTEVLDVGNPTGTLLVIYFNGTGNEFLGELRYTEGLPMNQLYVKSFNRNANGDILVGNNGRLTNDVTSGPLGTGFHPVGSSIPKFIGGWNNTITYKNLTIGVHIDYKFGGTVLSSTLLNMTRQGHSKLSLEGRRDGESGLLIDGVNVNTGLPNTVVIPVTGNGLQNHYTDYRNYQIGDPFTFKSDFVKLRNISVSYNLTSAVRNIPTLNFIKGLTLSAACRNVAILYKDLPGLDPEAIQSSGDFRAGYENSSLPTTRNYNVTLNVRF